MDADGVGDLAGVAAGEGDGEWHAVAAAVIENERVAAAEPSDGEGEAAKLVFAERVGAGNVKHKIGAKFGEATDEMRFEDGEIVFVADAVGKIRVETRRRLGLGIIPFLMNGKCEYGIVARENCGGAVALMNVGVDDHGRFDGAFVLQAANGDGDVVNDAKSFAMIGERVMETAADVRGAAVRESALPCFDGAARAEPARFDEFFRVRNFHAQLFDRTERAGLEFVDIFVRVDAQNIFVGSRRWRDEVGRRGEFLFDERVADEAVFLRWENVRAEVEVVAFVVDERDGRHRERE